MAYRKCRKGDTIRITGDRGQHLFNSEGNVELKYGVNLGIECVLVGGEDTVGNVEIPRGILANDQVYLDARCIELVQAVEDKPTAAVEDKAPTVTHMVDGPDDCLYIIDDSESKDSIARIWYDPTQVPRKVVKAFVEDIKAIIVKRKTKNSKSIMENKTFDDEFESKFGEFERQLAAMHDPSPNEIREFIATVILASAHDSSLVDTAFKFVRRNNQG